MVHDKHYIGRKVDGTETYLTHSGEFSEFSVETRIEFTRFSKRQAETIVNTLNKHVAENKENLKGSTTSQNELEFFIH
jgi:tellurite resistance protein